MPSMPCHECKKVKKCTMVLERDEREATVGVYYCAPCRRAIEDDKRTSQEASA